MLDHSVLAAEDVSIASLQWGARRSLRANVTAMLGVDVPPGATGRVLGVRLMLLLHSLIGGWGCLLSRRAVGGVSSYIIEANTSNQHSCGCVEDDIAAALEVERISADDPIALLSSDPDLFFGRTTKVRCSVAAR